MEDKKCKKCGKELKNNKRVLCGKCKSEFIGGVVKVGIFSFTAILGILTKGKIKGKS
ncbi:hypothetical protein [Clostridium sp.]